MADSKPQIYMMGASLGTGNRGVSALGASFARLVWENKPDASISMLIGNRTADANSVKFENAPQPIGVLNYRRSFKAPLQQQLLWWFFLSIVYRCVPFARRWIVRKNPLVAKTVSAEFVGDIRGGDSFSDIYGLANFIWACLPVIAVLMVRPKFVLLPQTYGPFKSPLAKAFARFILRRASLIICRDKESMRTVDELVPNLPARFCPDVAFCLEPAPPAQPAIEPPLPADADLIIGLNVNGLVYNGGYTRSNMFGLKLDYPAYVAELVKQVLSNPAARVLLVPHTFAPDGNVESDPAACRKLKLSLPAAWQERIHLVTREYDQHEIKGLIGLCDFFIGSRMHACIAALSQGIPTVGVAYSKKFAGVFASVSADTSVIDGRYNDASEAVTKTLQLFNDREQTKAKLATGVPEAQEAIRKVFSEVFQPARVPQQAAVVA